MKLLIERQQVDAALAACNVQVDGEPYVDWQRFVAAIKAPTRYGHDDQDPAIPNVQPATPTLEEEIDALDDVPSEEALAEMEARLAAREGIQPVSFGDPDLSHDGRSFASDRFVDG